MELYHRGCYSKGPVAILPLIPRCIEEGPCDLVSLTGPIKKQCPGTESVQVNTAALRTVVLSSSSASVEGGVEKPRPSEARVQGRRDGAGGIKNCNI